ncbi:hypothetical protein CSIM01_13878 [Colletotrichum simmondsii]|uniref:Uncharacterized protein n=1 Tax=Colletotrichum simmondsii TaxID=703756 RepID=A0A135TJZ7_9PEZI|nr:hypothetical protein CSIM01_13878 [Colletotrichum simmondsii]
MSAIDAKQAFQAQLDLVAQGMLAAGFTGKEAAQMATDAIYRTWSKTDKDAPDEEGEDEEMEEQGTPQTSRQVLLPTIEFLTPRKGKNTPTAARYSSGKKRAQRPETLALENRTPIKKRRS